MHGCHDLGMGDTLGHHHSQIAFNRLVLGHGFELWHNPLQYRIQFEFEHHRSLRQIPGLAPLRMQLAHKTDGAPVEQHTRAAPGVHGRMRRRLEGGVQRRQQGLYVALHVKEVNGLLFAAPLQRIVRPVGQTRHAHGLVKAFHRGVGVAHTGIAQEHTPQLEHTHAFCLAVEVELQNL
ncbi:hypothetical protein D3C72_1787050 [compost metagenome]